MRHAHQLIALAKTQGAPSVCGEFKAAPGDMLQFGIAAGPQTQGPVDNRNVQLHAIPAAAIVNQRPLPSAAAADWQTALQTVVMHMLHFAQCGYVPFKSIPWALGFSSCAVFLMSVWRVPFFI
jgi:hypothetical protein